jgi:hypothetical protein
VQTKNDFQANDCSTHFVKKEFEVINARQIFLAISITMASAISASIAASAPRECGDGSGSESGLRSCIANAL